MMPPAAGAAKAKSKGGSHITSDRDDSKDEASTDSHIQLLTEHFGFNPKAFIDALVYLSNEHLYKIAEEFGIFALESLQGLEGGDLEAEQGVHAILTLLENALDHTLDTFELYCLRSVFGIKARQARLITLAHHRGLDLRPHTSSGNSGGASKTTKSRKSLVGASPSMNTNERSHELGAEEDTLKRKIAAARHTQHTLLMAKNVAEFQLARATLLHERFESALGLSSSQGDELQQATSAPMVSDILVQHARKLTADTNHLLKSLQELRSIDPLGAPLEPVASKAE